MMGWKICSILATYIKIHFLWEASFYLFFCFCFHFLHAHFERQGLHRRWGEFSQLRLRLCGLSGQSPLGCRWAAGNLEPPSSRSVSQSSYCSFVFNFIDTYFTYHKALSGKVDSSAFHIFTELFNNHHILILEHFHHF